MGSHRSISLLYVILCTSTPSAQRFMSLDCEHSVTGIFNEDTKLPCRIKSKEEGTIDYIQLKKYGEETLMFNSNKSSNGRVKLLQQDSKDISLVIQKTQVSDIGTYNYYLETDVGYDNQDITLMVKAPYSLPKVTLFPNLTRTMRTTNLSCVTTGYPLAQIHWFVNGMSNLTSKSKTSSIRTTEGLFKITSMLQIEVMESDLEGSYTCAVWNVEQGFNEVQKDFQILDLPNHDPQSEGKKNKVLTAVFVIVGALLSGIVILAVLRFKRRWYPVRRGSRYPNVVTKKIDVVYMDFSKAFDKVPHGCSAK
ncbi:CD276 antigen isoform X2 [Heptranchias perlo]|uniref:CD276 antigen isoform X2 n=1 Tax=Heptranchias perlo TaxID=212740 RepID=UPI003559A7D0